MGQVGGEAVADVDAGRGQIATEKGFAGVEAGFGEEMRMIFGCGGEWVLRLRERIVASSAAAPPSWPVT